MKRIEFYNNNRSGDLLHIETEGCIINIRVNLHDTEGREVTSISIKQDEYRQEEWDLDGTINNRVIRRKKDRISEDYPTHTAE